MQFKNKVGINAIIRAVLDQSAGRDKDDYKRATFKVAKWK